MTVFTVSDPRDGSGNRDLYRPNAEHPAERVYVGPYLTEWRHTDGAVTSVFGLGGGSSGIDTVTGWSVRDAGDQRLFSADMGAGRSAFEAALTAPSSEPMRQLLFRGDDRITGGAAANVLDGLGGADTIAGAAGNDTIDGGDGRSYLRGDEGDDRITGGADFDDINGNMGNDTAAGGAGDDWVVGGKDDDRLAGDAGADLVYGNLGADTCEGGDGNDIVRGGQDADVLFGGAGDDYLSGDRGHDTMTGGAGADTFHSFGEAATDRVVDFNRLEGDRVLLDSGTTYAVNQVGADTIIDLGGGGRVILEGVTATSLAEGWIVVG